MIEQKQGGEEKEELSLLRLMRIGDKKGTRAWEEEAKAGQKKRLI